MPTQEELLIIALGLGGSGNNYNPLPDNPQIVGPPGPPGDKGTYIVAGKPGVPGPTTKLCPQPDTTRQICQHIPGKI